MEGAQLQSAFCRSLSKLSWHLEHSDRDYLSHLDFTNAKSIAFLQCVVKNSLSFKMKRCRPIFKYFGTTQLYIIPSGTALIFILVYGTRKRYVLRLEGVAHHIECAEVLLQMFRVSSSSRWFGCKCYIIGSLTVCWLENAAHIESYNLRSLITASQLFPRFHQLIYYYYRTYLHSFAFLFAGIK